MRFNDSYSLRFLWLVSKTLTLCVFTWFKSLFLYWLWKIWYFQDIGGPNGVYIESNTRSKWNKPDKCNTNLLNIFGRIVFCKTEKIAGTYIKQSCVLPILLLENFFLTITCKKTILQLSNLWLNWRRDLQKSIWT